MCIKISCSCVFGASGVHSSGIFAIIAAAGVLISSHIMPHVFLMI
jgi:hypothetical protein